MDFTLNQYYVLNSLSGKKNFSVFLNIKLIQIKEWLKLTLWMYAHINLIDSSFRTHCQISLLIFDKVLYFYLLHDIYLANNLLFTPPLPRPIYLKVYIY